MEDGRFVKVEWHDFYFDVLSIIIGVCEPILLLRTP